MLKLQDGAISLTDYSWPYILDSCWPSAHLADSYLSWFSHTRAHLAQPSVHVLYMGERESCCQTPQEQKAQKDRTVEIHLPVPYFCWHCLSGESREDTIHIRWSAGPANRQNRRVGQQLSKVYRQLICSTQSVREDICLRFHCNL